MSIDYEGQIYRAIALSDARSSWKVVRVLVNQKTWQEIAASLSIFMRHRTIHFHLDGDKRDEPAVTELYIRGVPIIANEHAGPGFTLEQAQTVQFRA